VEEAGRCAVRRGGGVEAAARRSGRGGAPGTARRGVEAAGRGAAGRGAPGRRRRGGVEAAA